MKENTLGKIIEAARQKKKLSQRELARRTKIDNAEISRIEKGTRIRPGLIPLKKLAKELNLEMRLLMEKAEYDDMEIEIFSDEDCQFTESEPPPQLGRFYDYARKVGETRVLDFLKIIKGYKEDDLTEEEVVNLLSLCLGRNIKEYIFEDQQHIFSYAPVEFEKWRTNKNNNNSVIEEEK